MPASSSEVQELLAKLVAFDTTSAKSNLGLISFVKTYLDGYGVASTLTPSADGAKASLFASIGPSGGGIGLSGHSDCVPVEGQTWSNDPFKLKLRDGKLYGRGSCDMKGFLACVLASVPLGWLHRCPSADRAVRIRSAAPPRHHCWGVHQHESDRRA
jgi:acetylornithine deacetylase